MDHFPGVRPELGDRTHQAIGEGIESVFGPVLPFRHFEPIVGPLEAGLLGRRPSVLPRPGWKAITERVEETGMPLLGPASKLSLPVVPDAAVGSVEQRLPRPLESDARDGRWQVLPPR